MAVYLTGDTHGDFDRIEAFCAEYDTAEDDTMVILGDAGFNFFLDERDEAAKRQVAQLPITLLCVHGNHEERPSELPGYETMMWHGGLVWYEPDYPNILFAEDGEVYDFDGKRALVIGGAYSVDKYYRMANGLPWFPTEQPDEHVKAKVEAALETLGWRVDYVFSHTVPYGAMPHHAMLPTIDQSTVDKSTEQWLQTIESRLSYERWYAGHFHITWNMANIQILFEDYEELGGLFY